jgi:hypothetical protein
MLRLVWTAVIVMMLTIPISAQQVANAPVDIPAFSSVELLVNCVAQFAMGNKDLVQMAINRGDVFMVPKGTTIMGMSHDESGIFSFMVKGKPGLWYSASQFFRD